MRRVEIIFTIFCLLVVQSYAYAQNPSDYLILQDIGSYTHKVQTKDFITLQPKIIPGYTIWNNAGILVATGHFPLDHKDTNYETVYESDVTDMGVSVQVTQHAGADSDRWLLHEVEHGYRRSKELKATYSAPNPIRIINNNKIWFQWGAYRWVNNNIVVSIEFTDLTGTKPEPLEVVQAYLQKFPSTITLTDAEIKSKAHSETWLKDEMERRLWLCDKWNAQFQLGKVSQADMLKQLADHMTVFLKYRQRYYGIDATDDINALFDYSRNNDAAAIMNKLTAYKAWWTANKGNAINL